MNRRYENESQWNQQDPQGERGGQRWQQEDGQRGGREFGSRDQGWGQTGRREPGQHGWHNEQYPSARPDYSHRYSSQGETFERPRGSQAGSGYGGGHGGEQSGYYSEDPLGRGQQYGQQYGGQSGGNLGGGRYGSSSGNDWRGGDYNQFESSGRLPPIGGGTNLQPQPQGGGRYTQSGYGGSERDFGSSYGRASGYGDEQRFSHEPGRSGGFRESQSGGQGYNRDYARGAGGGAFGSGMSGEYGGQIGPHRGRGPKGYARSDERLQEDICERLTDDHHIDASDISVETRDGIVTLSGTVSERWMKYHAEDLIDRCPGVKDIRNQLSVSRQESTSNDENASLRDSGERSREKHNEGVTGANKKH